jgi:hypothetical protein
MSTAGPAPNFTADAGVNIGTIFGRAMALVAVTVGFAAVGIWIGQDLAGWRLPHSLRSSP